MDNLPSWLVKIQSLWVSIGTLLILLSAKGLDMPDILLKIFSQDLLEAAVAVMGAVIVFYQFIRAQFAKTDASVKVLSVGSKIAYALNPFKLNI